MNAKENDQLLWASIQDNSKEAFETVYRLYVKRLYNLVSKRIDEKDYTEDIVQDVFLTLWEKRAIYNPQGELYPYLCGMAINRVLNHFRMHKIKPKHIELWENLPENIADLQELSLAFKQAQNEEMENLLDKAIESLPKRLKAVYHLRYEEERSVKEISVSLATTPSTIYSQLDTIRKKFLNVLKETSYYTFF